MKKLLLLIFVCCSTISTIATSVWDGQSVSFDWYTGASDNVYYISTAADLAGLSKSFSDEECFLESFSGKTICLNSDIDLKNFEWTPICGNYNQHWFEGSIDGNNHVVKNMSITKDYKYLGLFGAVVNFQSGGYIKNLYVQGSITVDNHTGEYVGGIVGYFSGDPGQGQIYSCSTDITINVNKKEQENYGSYYIGGIAGRIYGSVYKLESHGSIVIDEKRDPNVNISNLWVGGITGEISVADREYSDYNRSADLLSADVNIHVESEAPYVRIGGIFGEVSINYVNNCRYIGTIYGWSSGTLLVGGIAGAAPTLNNWCNAHLNSSLMVGNLSANATTLGIGAIVGSTSSKSCEVTNCYYLNSVTNNTGFGTAKSEDQLKSGEVLEGLETTFWTYQEGEFPQLSFTKVELPQCEMPTITIEDNKLIASCSTEDAEICLSINPVDYIQNELLYDGEGIELTGTYIITAYATAEGYSQSPIAESYLYWIKPSFEQNSENSIQMEERMPLLIKTSGDQIILIGTQKGVSLSIFSIDGKTIYNGLTQEGETIISIQCHKNSILLICYGNTTIKYKS